MLLCKLGILKDHALLGTLVLRRHQSGPQLRGVRNLGGSNWIISGCTQKPKYGYTRDFCGPAQMQQIYLLATGTGSVWIAWNLGSEILSPAFRYLQNLRGSGPERISASVFFYLKCCEQTSKVVRQSYSCKLGYVSMKDGCNMIIICINLMNSSIPSKIFHTVNHHHYITSNTE